MAEESLRTLRPPKVLSLDGLEGLRVIVKGFPPDGVEGLTREAIQEQAEKQLAAAEIRALDEESSQRSAGRPVLLLLAGIVKYPRGFCIYTVQAQVKQDVWLSRNPRLTTNAATWEGLRHYGASQDGKLADALRSAARQSVEELVAAWQAANRRAERK